MIPADPPEPMTTGEARSWIRFVPVVGLLVLFMEDPPPARDLETAWRVTLGTLVSLALLLLLIQVVALL
jgi:hypothetical protein